MIGPSWSPGPMVCVTSTPPRRTGALHRPLDLGDGGAGRSRHQDLPHGLAGRGHPCGEGRRARRRHRRGPRSRRRRSRPRRGRRCRSGAARGRGAHRGPDPVGGRARQGDRAARRRRQGHRRARRRRPPRRPGWIDADDGDHSPPSPAWVIPTGTLTLTPGVARPRRAPIAGCPRRGPAVDEDVGPVGGLETVRAGRLQRRPEHRDGHHEGDPDDERGGGGGGAARVPAGVVAGQAARHAPHRGERGAQRCRRPGRRRGVRGSSRRRR